MFDLNTTLYPWLNKDAPHVPDTDMQTWMYQVAAFHRLLEEFSPKFKSGSSEDSTYKRTDEIKPEAKDLWKDLLGFKADDQKQSNNVFAPLGSVGGPDQPLTDKGPTHIHADRLLHDAVRQPGMAPADSVQHAAINALTSSSIGGHTVIGSKWGWKNADEKISESVTLLNAGREKRSATIKTELNITGLALQTIKKLQRSDAYQVMHKHLDNTKLNNKDDASGYAEMAYSIAYNQEFVSAMRNTPEYINKALTAISDSPLLRKYFGMTVDYELDLPVTGQHKINVKWDGDYFGNKDQSIEVAFETITGPAGSTTILRAVARKTNKVALPLREKCKIASYEVQAAAHNADDALDNLARQPRQTASLLPIRTNALLSLNNNLKVAMAEGIVNAPQNAEVLSQISASGVQANLLRSFNNQITNIKSKGHTIFYLGDVDDPGTNNDSDLFEEDMIGGYAVYVRMSNKILNDPKNPDQKQKTYTKWRSLTAIEETQPISKSAIGNPIYKRYERGVNLRMGVLIGEAKKDTGHFDALTDGFAALWEGQQIPHPSPLRHQDRDRNDSLEERLTSRTNALYDHLKISPEGAALQSDLSEQFRIEWPPYEKNIHERPEFLVRRRGDTIDGSQPYTARLQFNNHTEYEYLLVPVYHNGYVPLKIEDVNLIFSDTGKNGHLDEYISPPASFERYDHVGNLVVSLAEDIYYPDSNDNAMSGEQAEPGKKLKRNNLGESPFDLVVRSTSGPSKGLPHNNSCVRYILPPQVPGLEKYLWYSKAGRSKLKADMDGVKLHKWFLRYQCEVKTKEKFEKNIDLCNKFNEMFPGKPCTVRGCNAGCSQMCKSTEQPAVWDGELRYLPDPVVTGFLLRFFLDKECTIPAPSNEFPNTFCSYNKEHYPQIPHWHMILSKDNIYAGESSPRSKIKLNTNKHTVEISLKDGMQIYAQATATFDKNNSHFADPILLNKNAKLANMQALEKWIFQTDDYYCNLLLSNSTVFSLTHATQRPLMDPMIQNISIKRYNSVKNRSGYKFDVEVNMRFEHLNAHYHIPLPFVAPTGELELLGLWNDYTSTSSKPLRSIEEKRPDFQSIGSILYDKQLATSAQYKAESGSTGGFHPFINILDTVNFTSDPAIRITHHSQMLVKVRNTSKFYPYFTDKPLITKYDRDMFSRYSKEYSLERPPTPVQRTHYSDSVFCKANFLFNNQKPIQPFIRKIVPLIVRDESHEKNNRSLRYRGNRVRIYFYAKGRMFSGEGERIGVLVKDTRSRYDTYFNNYISRCGKDAVTDLSDDQSSPATIDDDGLMGVDAFNKNDTSLENDYLIDFDPKPDTDYAKFNHYFSPLGLITYAPQWDETQDLWFIDIDLNIVNQRNRQLHNVFVQLGLVTYQPFSANYSNNTAKVITDDDFALDLRLSKPIKADFFSIYPDRTFSTPSILHMNNEENILTLNGDLTSLFIKEEAQNRLISRSQFLIVAQQKRNEQWINIETQVQARSLYCNERMVYEETVPANNVYNALLDFDELFKRVNGGELLNSSFEIKVKFSIAGDNDTRLVVYEVELFTARTQTEILKLLNRQDDEYSQQNPDHAAISPAVIPGVRVKEIYLFDYFQC